MDEKELVKQKTDIVALVGSVVQLKQAGTNLKGLCPFHHEKSPSFMVNPEMGIFKCFGCGEAGDCFAWMMKIEGMSFPEALRELAEKAGVKLSGQFGDKTDRHKQEILEALALAGRFYEYLLMKHPVGEAAREYLNKRGVTSESIKTFGLGWAPLEWDGLQRALESKGVKLETMESAGLVVRRDRGGYYDRFRGRVMFELRNVRGQVVGLAGRILEAKADVPKYINSPETAVYHKGELLYGLDISKQQIRNAKRMIIVEGELDMISSYQVGVEEVVALKGTALTESQVNLVKRYAEVVVLALDMDFAGDKAARRSMQMLEKAGLQVKMVRLPQGSDPDDLARNDSKKWRELVEKAVDVYEFWLQSAMERYEVNSGYGKTKIFEELIPIWQEIENEILQAHWVGELARRVGVDEELVWRQIRGKRGEVVEMEKNKKNYPHDDWLDAVVGWYLQNDIQELSNPEWQELNVAWLTKLIKILEQNGWKKELPAELEEKVAVAEMKSDLAGLNQEMVRKWKGRLLNEAIKQKIRSLKTQNLEEDILAKEAGRLAKLLAELEK